MAVLDDWLVVLSVPADLVDDEAAALAAEIGERLRSWLVAETSRLAGSFPGCTVSLDGE